LFRLALIQNFSLLICSVTDSGLVEVIGFKQFKVVLQYHITFCINWIFSSSGIPDVFHSGVSGMKLQLKSQEQEWERVAKYSKHQSDQHCASVLQWLNDCYLILEHSTVHQCRTMGQSSVVQPSGWQTSGAGPKLAVVVLSVVSHDVANSCVEAEHAFSTAGRL